MAQTMQRICNVGDRVQSLGQENLLEKEMSTSGIFAWRIQGQRSLAGYNPRGCRKSDMTEEFSTYKLTFFFSIFLPTYSYVLFGMFICFLSLRIEWTFL